MNGIDQLLPASVDPEQIVHRIGILSDTHAPQRLPELPAAVFEIFSGADLILHAGDVGELWVLDQLSALAPVVAVHGNDDSAASHEILPNTQIVAVHGLRILLWHSHFPDWDEELAARQDDAMIPKLERIAARGAQFACPLIIFGHWHIPLIYHSQGVTLVNPGALASGNEITRQLRQTAAILFLESARKMHIAHVDLAVPDRVFNLPTDVHAGFLANAKQFSATIISDELTEIVFALRRELSRAEILQIRESILPLAHRCWQGEWTTISPAQFKTAIQEDSQLPESIRRRVLDIMDSLPNTT